MRTKQRHSQCGVSRASMLTTLGLITLFSCSQTTLQVRSELLSTNAPFSFPDTLVVGPNGNLYLFNTNLSSIFTIDSETGSVERICGTEKSSNDSFHRRLDHL